MSMIAAPPISADELLRMPDGDRFELVNGELVEQDMGAISGWVGGQAFAKLNDYSKTYGGTAFGDGVGYQCYADDPDRVRRPDASYLRPGRLAEIPDGHMTIAPDLVVEVVSPNDLYRDVESKVDEYLEAGVRMVWVINPANRSVRVFRQGRPLMELRSPDDLTGDDILPEFRCRVSDLFPPPPSHSATPTNR